MASVIIAAHNEEAVIGRCLAALRASAAGAEVIVAANGCSDNTVEIARSHGSIVVETPVPSKAIALNAGDAIATQFPRIYLDADIVVPLGAVDGLAAVLSQPGTLAAVPARKMDVRASSLGVQAYFAINSLLPAANEGLFGRGMIAISEEGRSRFGDFPILVADDLFLDSLFSASEKAVSRNVEVTVEAPRATADLVRRLIRVRSGNSAMRAAADSGQVRVSVRRADRWAWIRVVVPRRPWLIPAALAYAIITLTADVLILTRRRKSPTWGRDESTRRLRD